MWPTEQFEFGTSDLKAISVHSYDWKLNTGERLLRFVVRRGNSKLVFLQSTL